ncbi:S-methyl-5'-thioadenosine phosphorylase [Zancudomyces culisetae]|uniref:Purine nucleoside phosphorylase n=1 Tax=Zancudomyces culisetae TaxID=1213189 RepID=A0A1R1PLD3_ZANCU|nr:S-methyl-5'-thioadenosine phosphorylase [Zancudomyces culisetae]|eukprot:OMH81780.1 S-methyl-5'-thioadenosine phosphorylase [Zancudomyces culisetae]
MSVKPEFKDIRIGVIGGTGFYNLKGLKPITKLDIDTPWGKPSSPLFISETESGHKIAFLARHGENHERLPTEVNFQANIAALKHVGVRVVIAFSAVGSLREEVRPMDFVIPDQIIDRTKGIRKDTYFGNGLTGHATFGDPYHEPVAQLIKAHEAALENMKLIKGGTVVAIEGPLFSTRAESKMYRLWGGDIINMTAVPEAKLAREAEIAYQMVCMATDYDSWRDEEASVSTTDVLPILKKNSENANKLLVSLLPALVEKVYSDQQTLEQFTGTSGMFKASLMQPPALRNPEQVQKLLFMYPEGF